MSDPVRVAFADLEHVASAFASAVSRESVSLAKASAAGVQARPSRGELLALRSVATNVRFELSAGGARSEPAFAGSVAMGTEPALDATPAAAAARLPPVIRLPRFLVVRPSAAFIERFAPPGAPAERIVAFRLGPSGEDVACFARPGDVDEARLRYTRAGAAPLDCGPDDDIWPLRPFFDLIEALRLWSAEPTASHEEVDADPPPDAPRSLLSEAIEALAKARVAAIAQLGEPPPESLEPLLTRHRLADFSATLLMHIDRDGKLSASRKDAGLVQLAASVAAPDVAEARRMTVVMSAPDFLIRGDLHRAFGDAVRSEGKWIYSLLAEAGAPEREAFERFLEKSSRSVFVMRIERGEQPKPADESRTDVNLLIFRGEIDGVARVFVLSSRFAVNTARGEVAVDKGPKNDALVSLFRAAAIDGIAKDKNGHFRALLLTLAHRAKRWLGAIG